MKLTIPKLDAAKRQLETAIRLYFSSADPVAVHTLTAAAYNVIRDVTAKLGAEPMSDPTALGITETATWRIGS